jgi:hypothetical protein
LLPVPAGRLSFVLPAEKLSVRVNGSSGAFHRSVKNESERIELPVGRGGNVTVSWQPERQAGSGDAIVIAQTAQALRIDDAGLGIDSHIQLQVRQGTINDFTLTYPAAVKVKGVSGADVVGWEIRAEDSVQSIRVFFGRGVSDATALQVKLYQSASFDESGSALTLAQLVPQGVARETGQVAVYADETFSLRGTAGAGGRQLNPDQFRAPKSLQAGKQAPRLAYRFSARPFDLALRVARRVPETRAEAEYAAAIGRRKLKLSARFRLQLTGAPRSRISVYLPEGFLPLSLDATSMTDWYLHDDEGQQLAIIELAAPRTGLVEIVLNGTVPRVPDDLSAALDLPVPFDVDRMNSQLAVWVDSSYTARLGDRADWRNGDPRQLAGDFRALYSVAPQFTLRSTVPAPDVLTILLNPIQTKLTADAVTIVNVADAAVHYTLALKWQIPQGAAETFSFTTDSVLPGRLDFKGSELRGVSEKPADDGRVLWTVTTQRRVSGQYFVTATATLPPSQDGTVVAPVPVFVNAEGPNPSGRLETQRQFVLLVNHSTAQIAPVNPDDLDPVEPGELPITVQQTLIDQATDVARVRSVENAPAWSLTRFDRQPGAPASVNLADLITVIEADGTFRAAVDYRIKNRSRQFLAVEMPEDVHLLSILVKDRPSRAVRTQRNGRPIDLIALPKTSAADLSFNVRIVYSGRLSSGPLPRGFRVTRSDVKLTAPRVLSLEDDAEFGIPVAETRWTVHFPNDFEAIPIDDRSLSNLRPTDAARSLLIDEKLLIREAQELTNLFLTDNSGSMLYEAYGNLDKLERRLHENTASESLSDDEEGQRVRKQRLKVLGEIRSNRTQVQVDNQGKSITRNVDGRNSAISGDGEEFGLQLRSQTDQLHTGNTFQQKNRISDILDGTSNTFAMEENGRAGEKGDSDWPAKKSAGKDGKGSVGKEINRRRGASGKEEREVQQRELSSQLQRQQSFTAESFSGVQFNRLPPNSAPVPPQVQENAPQSGSDIESEFQVRSDFAFSTTDFPAALVEGDMQEWTSSGGLSLVIDVPTAGRKITFSKIGGAPELAVGVRPKRSLKTGFGIVWALVWIAVAAFAVTLLSRSQRLGVQQPLSKAAMTIGLVGFFLMTAPWSWLGFVLFLLGALTFGFQRSAATA